MPNAPENTKELTFCRLTNDDSANIETLLQSDPNYFQDIHGHPPTAEAQSLLTTLPRGKTFDQKHVLGAFHQSELIGVIDLVSDYPVEGSWVVGWLFIEPAFRRRGLASQFTAAVEDWIIDKGAQKARAAVPKFNQAANQFLDRLGFRTVEARADHEFGERIDTLLIMEKDLV